jgi:recombinational DNA repair ATPase RecF
MAIRIDSISVKGLGPISSLQWVLKDINLVFGKNEQGKTFLVEFILRSLFKNSPKTRELTDSGQVIVSGLENSPHIFHPKGKEKIEDFVFDLTNTPVDLSRLCVVKGGDLSMTNSSDETVTKSILKEYLSDQGMLDRILNRVLPVIQESSWEQGLILPKRQVGIIKSWKEAKERIERIKELISVIDEEYSQGVGKKADIDLEEIKKRIAEQERAKRIHAYNLSIKIDLAQKELDTIPEEYINRARISVNRVEELLTQLQSKMKQVRELKPKVKYYQWLKSAIEECQKRPEGQKRDIKQLYLILAVISITATIAFSFIEPLASLAAGIFAILFIFLSIKQYQYALQYSVDLKEVEKIYQEYESKFGEKVKSIATLTSTLESIQPQFFELETINNQIAQQEEDLSKAELEKKRDLAALGKIKTGVKDPHALINKAQENRKNISEKIGKLERELAATNVIPEEFSSEVTDSKYIATELSECIVKRFELEALIANENSRLQSLKQRICDLTFDNISISWEDLIQNLRTKLEQTIEECKSIHAQIASGIFVTEVINNLREQEDQQISIALSSELMKKPIKLITPSYEGVDLDGEELIVYNDMERFPLSVMSTGAKEQVLLALRIGLAEHILGEKKMFLVLDDAFQHSDWDRRERLVDEMTMMAKTGWQILYFSMDDHIKQLFEDRVKPVFGKRYEVFELNSK